MSGRPTKGWRVPCRNRCRGSLTHAEESPDSRPIYRLGAWDFDTGKTGLDEIRYSIHVIRQVGQVSPSRSVPQMKHCRKGPRAVGTPVVPAASFCGNGGGDARVSMEGPAGGSGDEAGAVTDSEGGETVDAGGSMAVGAGDSAAEAVDSEGAGDEEDGAASDVGVGAGASVGGSFSFRFLRKNDIRGPRARRTLLLRVDCSPISVGIRFSAPGSLVALWSNDLPNDLRRSAWHCLLLRNPPGRTRQSSRMGISPGFPVRS